MIKIVWEFEEQRWRDPLSRAAFEAALDGVRHYLADLRCPVHGESPSVVVRGETEDTIRLDLRGCCDRLVGPARAKLAELEGGSEVEKG